MGGFKEHAARAAVPSGNQLTHQPQGQMSVSGLCTSVPGTVQVWSAVALQPRGYAVPLVRGSPARGFAQSETVRPHRHKKLSQAHAPQESVLMCLTCMTDTAQAAHAQAQPHVTPTQFPSLLSSSSPHTHTTSTARRLHSRVTVSRVAFAQNPVVATSDDAGTSSARRRRRERLRSWLRHERMTVAMGHAAATHHSSPKGGWPDATYKRHTRTEDVELSWCAAGAS